MVSRHVVCPFFIAEVFIFNIAFTLFHVNEIVSQVNLSLKLLTVLCFSFSLIPPPACLFCSCHLFSLPDSKLVPDLSTEIGKEVSRWRKTLDEVPVFLITYGVFSYPELSASGLKTPKRLQKSKTGEREGGGRGGGGGGGRGLLIDLLYFKDVHQFGENFLSI